MADRRLQDGAEGPPDKPDSGTAQSVLVIGRADDASLAQAAALGGTTFVAPVGDLDAALLARLLPDWVIFPLMAVGFDAPLVIELLASLGYTGGACVLSPRLPNRRMVEIELRAMAPALHLVLVEAAE